MTVSAAPNPRVGFLRENRQRSAVALLVGAVLLLGLTHTNVVPFYGTPLIVGLSYLAAAAVAGRSGALWAPGIITTCWGIAVLLGAHGVITGNKTAYLIAGAAGIGLALVLRLTIGLAAGVIGIVVSFAAIALYDNPYAPAWIFHGSTFAVLLAGWGLWDLRPPRRSAA